MFEPMNLLPRVGIARGFAGLDIPLRIIQMRTGLL